MNAGVQRGRTVPSPRFEMLHVPVRPDGTYAIDELKLRLGNPGRWFLVFEEPGHAPAVFGPSSLKPGERSRRSTWTSWRAGRSPGGSSTSPRPMAGQVWVVAFNENVIRREARVGRDGTFRLDGLPPGRYGVKVGHDAYRDPHIPEIPPIGQERTPQELAHVEEEGRALAGRRRGERPAVARRPRKSSSTSARRVRSSTDEKVSGTQSASQEGEVVW